MQGKLYSVGYQGLKLNDLAGWAEENDVIVADCRFSPLSSIPDWRKKAMEGRLGSRYLHVKAFGNENYKGGPIKLVDAEKGAEQVMKILEGGRNVVLLCACWSYTTCHRTTAANYIKEKYGVEYTNLKPAEVKPTPAPPPQRGLFE